MLKRVSGSGRDFSNIFALLFSLEEFTDEKVTSLHHLQGSETGRAEIWISLLKTKQKNSFVSMSIN